MFKRLVDCETDPGITVKCVTSNSYEAVQDLLAKQLSRGVCDNPRKIELTGQSSFSLKPLWSGPFAGGPGSTLQKMLQGSFGDRQMTTAFYEVLPFTLEEMKNKVVVSVAASKSAAAGSVCG
jgi:hypothetical protein